MSYILDALKKSAQERQQGTAPHLYSVHNSAPPGRNSSPLQQRGLLLILGGALLFFGCLVILLILNRQSVPPPSAALVSDPATNLEQPAEKAAKKVTSQDAKQNIKQPAAKIDGGAPQVIIKENNIVLRTVAIKDKHSPSPKITTTSDNVPSSLPQLKDLSPDIRAGIPELKFAGHTFSEDPAQRMIIVNGQILREGDTIAPSTHLSEITWEGVIIDFKGTRFLVKTN